MVYTHVLSTSGKYIAGFLVKSLGWCCGSTVLTGAYCWPLNNCIPVQKIVSLSTELTHNHSVLMLDSDNGVCCQSPLLFIVYIRVLHTAARVQIRPTKLFQSATKHIFPIIKKQYIYEKCVHLVECNIFRKNHITQDVWPSNCCAIAYVVSR